MNRALATRIARQTRKERMTAKTASILKLLKMWKFRFPSFIWFHKEGWAERERQHHKFPRFPRFTKFPRFIQLFKLRRNEKESFHPNRLRAKRELMLEGSETHISSLFKENQRKGRQNSCQMLKFFHYHYGNHHFNSHIVINVGGRRNTQLSL